MQAMSMANKLAAKSVILTGSEIAALKRTFFWQKTDKEHGARNFKHKASSNT